MMPTRRPLPSLPLLGVALLLLAGCAGGGPSLPGFRAPEPVATVPLPTAGYSADQIFTVDERSFTGRIYGAPYAARMELPTASQDVISVVRYDDDRTVTWDDQTLNWIEGSPIVSRLYVGHYGLDIRAPAYLAFALAPIGPERVNGLATTRYAYRATALDGGVREGEVWLTPENIVVRMEGTRAEPGGAPRRVAMRLENLRLGPQDPALFRRPPYAGREPLPEVYRGYPDPLGWLFRG